MEFSGKVIAILPARTGVSKSTGNEWKVQSYVVENHDQYPRRMCFEVFGGDKIDQFNIQMGEELNVSFDIDARQWNDKWFNTIRAASTQPAAEPVPPFAPEPAPFPGSDSNSTDDLPF